jgi:hypothetical protein
MSIDICITYEFQQFKDILIILVIYKVWMVRESSHNIRHHLNVELDYVMWRSHKFKSLIDDIL